MNTTELGVYILGAMALALLAAAGIALGNSHAIIGAVIAGGAAYIAQWCAALMRVATESDRHQLGGGLYVIGIFLMLISWGAWAFGVLALFP